ncbi:hypothetical protein J3Q64DRAFT_1828635 [Phycomyces blakesleeanus]|uniref:Homeodomain-like DNA binding domain-containing transcription factor n=1 Tax=Phycomyces blakesleeanus TaxID=4837 RepID=A0ABR3BF17_PHYBL
MNQPEQGSNPMIFSNDNPKHNTFEVNHSVMMSDGNSSSSASSSTNSPPSTDYTKQEYVPMPSFNSTGNQSTSAETGPHSVVGTLSETTTTTMSTDNNSAVKSAEKAQASAYDSMGLTGVFSMTDRDLVDRMAESTSIGSNDTSSAPQPTNEVSDWTNNYSSSIDIFNSQPKAHAPLSGSTDLKQCEPSSSSKSSSPMPHFNFTPNIRLDTPNSSQQGTPLTPKEPLPPASASASASVSASVSVSPVPLTAPEKAPENAPEKAPSSARSRIPFKKQVHMMKQYEERRIPARQIARESNIDLRTFYKVLRKFHKRGHVLSSRRHVGKKNKNRREVYKLTDRELRQLRRIEVREPRQNTYRQLAEQMSVITGRRLSPNYIERCLRSMGLRQPALIDRPYRRRVMRRHMKRHNRSTGF